MRLFLVAAAVIAVALPASADAQRSGGFGFGSSSSSGSAGSGAQGGDRWRDNPDFERDDRYDRDDDRRDRRRRGGVIVLGGYGGYGHRDINRSWQPDSFNDWWHERPHRSHPAWMSRNGNCERQYWSGGGWRC